MKFISRVNYIRLIYSGHVPLLIKRISLYQRISAWGEKKSLRKKKTSHEQSMSIKIINYDPISTAITLIVVPNKEISRKLQRYNLE